MRYYYAISRLVRTLNIYEFLSRHGGVWITSDLMPKRFINAQNEALRNFNQNLFTLTSRNTLNNRFRDINHIKDFFWAIGFEVVEIHKFNEVINEPLDEKLHDSIRGSDYLLHEAFCLENEVDKYKPREKNHETVWWVSRQAQELGVKNLVLWHMLENLGSLRKEKYIEEAQENFKGKVYVPNDLEIIEL